MNNEIDRALVRGDEPRRFVEVLIDKGAFSKENLTILFQNIAKRFPKPRTLFINAFVDLEDIETPEERDDGKLTGKPLNSNSLPSGINNSATFTRFNKKKHFIIDWADRGYEEVEIK